MTVPPMSPFLRDMLATLRGLWAKVEEPYAKVESGELTWPEAEQESARYYCHYMALCSELGAPVTVRHHEDGKGYTLSSSGGLEAWWRATFGEGFDAEPEEPPR